MPELVEGRRRGSKPAARRRLRFTDADLDKIRKMSVIGLKPRVMAYILGVTPAAFRGALKRDRELVREGKRPRGDNLYVAMQVGRANGDAELMKVAFEMATKGKNVAVLLHLLKTRLGQVEGTANKPGDTNVSIVFETQIGQDGQIRATERPLELPAGDGPSEHDDDGGEWLQ